MASPDVLLGAGLYETVRVSGGMALHGERHLARMTASAHALGLPPPAREAFARAIAEASGTGEVVRVRLTAADGEAELARRAPRGARPGAAAADAPARLVRAGLPAARAQAHEPLPRRAGPPAGAGRRATTTRCSVAHDGRVGEATNANVALIVGAVLVTPSVDGLLPGRVPRRAAGGRARGSGCEWRSATVALAELVDADGVLLTSSPRGISEAVELDGRAVRRVPPDLLAALREGVAAAARAHALALP